MNKFLTFPGLQPIYLGDIDFLQESVRDAFVLLLKGLTGHDSPRCILKEATLQSDGAICFDGEILPLKYGSVTNQSVYKIESAFSGQRVFKNQDSHACYETRYVIVSEGTADSPYNVAKFPTLQSLISNKSVASEEHEFTYESENFKSNVKITKIGRCYYLTGTFEQLRNSGGTLAGFRMNFNFPSSSNKLFVATAKTTLGRIFNIPLTLTEEYQTEGNVVYKYNRISLPADALLFLDADDDRYTEGYFSLIIQ